MMTILEPRNMLRVEDKFFPAWAMFDTALDTPGLLSVYAALWYFAASRQRPTQVELARCGKCGLRALQSNLNILEKRGYIAIRKEGGRNQYDLVLSPHVLAEFLRQGVKFQGVDKSFFVFEDAQILRIEHANSAPSLKDLKNIKKNTPLSPLPNRQTLADGFASKLTRESGESFRDAPPLRKRSSGNSPSGLQPEISSSPNPADFERIWEAWPVRQAKLPASRVFTSLAHQGRLPVVDVLLAVIDRLRVEDFRWRDGGSYVPRLDRWLRDERWNDTPVPSPLSEPGLATLPVMVSAVATPEAFAGTRDGGTAAGVPERDSAAAKKEEYPMKKPSMSAQTFAMLANSRWMSPTAIANLQNARCKEAAKEAADEESPVHKEPGKPNGLAAGSSQTRTGENRVSGLSGGNPLHAGAGPDAHHDVCGAERSRKTHHHAQAVLAIPHESGWWETSGDIFCRAFDDLRGVFISARESSFSPGFVSRTMPGTMPGPLPGSPPGTSACCAR